MKKNVSIWKLAVFSTSQLSTVDFSIVSVTRGNAITFLFDDLLAVGTKEHTGRTIRWVVDVGGLFTNLGWNTSG